MRRFYLNSDDLILQVLKGPLAKSLHGYKTGLLRTFDKLLVPSLHFFVILNLDRLKIIHLFFKKNNKRIN